MNLSPLLAGIAASLLLAPQPSSAAAAVTVAPAVESVSLFPWYANNAVLPPDVSFGPHSRETTVSGIANDPKSLVCSFSTDSESWLSVRRLGRQETATEPTRWEVSLRSSSWASRKALDSGRPFDVVFGTRQRRADPEPVFRVSNLIVGSVWALQVDPDGDSHKLPPLSPFAREKVRVLSFTGNFSPKNCTGWMSAAQAEEKGLRNFCGLPRAFANEISASGGPGVGIVLIPTNATPSNLPAGEKIKDWRPDRDENEPLLIAAVTAARVANEGPDHGAQRRHAKAYDDYTARRVDAKREGVVLPEFNIPQLLWGDIYPGDQEFIPFRVTGFIRLKPKDSY